MANSDKNIRITTSKNKTTYPNIVFTGSAAGSSVITLEVLDDNTLSFTSNEGQVFSIDSNLSTGTIWAVSDISGVPLLSASAGGTIGLGVYGGIIAIGQTNPTYKLDLKGSFGLASSNDGLYNFIFSNSAASGSNNLQIRSANSLLLYNSGNTFYTGFKSNASANVTYTLPTNDGSADQFLKTNGSGVLSWGTPTGGSGGGSTGVGQGGQYEVAYYPGTGASVIGNSNLKNNTATSQVSVSYTTAALDYTSGAFTVSGGVGIGGSLFVGGIGASISGVTISNSIITRGTWNGTAVATQYGGTGQNFSSSTGLVQISSGTASVITTSAALASIISDETGSGALVFGTTPTFTTSVVTSDASFAVFNTNATTINAFGAATILSLGAASGTATFNSINNTSSSSTGALVVTGGVGIGKSVSIGGNLLLFNGANYSGFRFTGSGNTTYTLPTTSPATGTSVLQSDASGLMSWVPMVAASSSSGAGSGTVAVPDAQFRLAYYAGTGASVSSTNFISAVGTGVTIFGATNASSTTVAALAIIGGLGITGNAFIGGTTNVINSTVSTGINSGALVVTGGVGIGGSLFTATSVPSSVSGVVLSNNFITSGTWSGSLITSLYGGTGFNSYTVGDLLVASTGTSLAKLAAGSTNFVLTSNGPGTVPTWQAVPASSATSVAATGTTVNQSFFITTVSAASGSGLGLSTIASFVVNPFSGLVSVSGFAVTSSTSSSSSTTGALTNAGGIGIAGNAFIGGTTNILSSVSSSGSNSGALVVTGGLGVIGNAFIGGTFTHLSNTSSFGTNSGSIVSAGGLGLAGNAFIGGTTNITNATFSSGSNSGALVITGGLGVIGNAFIGGTFNQLNNTSSSGTNSGSIVSVGGLGLAGNAFIGGTTNIINSTVSIGTNSGALVVLGGVGIGGSLFTATSVPSSVSGVVLSNNFITSGTWAGTLITALYGGTGFNSYAVGDLLYAATGTSLGKLPSGSTNFVLTSNGPGTVPSWQAVPPSAASTVAVRETVLFQSFYPTFVSSSSGTGLGLSTVTTIFVNPATGVLSATGFSAGIALTVIGTSPSVSSSTGALIVSGGTGIGGSLFVAAASRFESTAASISTGTGAIVVSGGLGLAGNAFIGGTVNVTSNASSSGSNSGSIVSAGGLGIVGNAFIGGTFNQLNNTSSFGTNSGSIVSAGGLGLVGNAFIGGTTTHLNNTSSSGTNSGSIVSTGGLGLAGNAFIGGTVNVTTNTSSFSTNSGSIVSVGGLGLGGNAFIGGTTNILNSAVSIGTNSGALVVTGGVGIGGSLFTGTAVPSSVSGVILSNGAITASSINRVAITAPATSATLTLFNGSTLATSGAFSLTFTTTATSSLTVPNAGTLTTTGNKLSDFAATTSLELKNTISDETGSGALVFATSPDFTTSVTTGSATFSVFNANATNISAFGAATTLSMGASSGTVTVNSINNALTSSSGALVVVGGVGIGKSVSVAGSLLLFNGSNYAGFRYAGSAITSYTLPDNSPQSSVGTSVLASDITGAMRWVGMAAGSGSATPGGSDTQVQYNSGGTFAGATGMTWNNGSNLLTLAATTTLTTSTQTALRIANINNTDPTTNIRWSPALEMVGLAGAQPGFGQTYNTRFATEVVPLGPSNYSAYLRTRYSFDLRTASPSYNNDLFRIHSSFGVGIGASDSNSNAISYFRVNTAQTGELTYILPPTYPATGTSVLQSDTSGTLLWVGVSSAAPGGSGTVNSGTGGSFAFYPATGTAVNGSSLITVGGAGVTIGSTLNASSTLAAALSVRGGIGITGNAFIGGTTNITNTTEAVSITSGALTVAGGAGIAKSLFVGQALTVGESIDYAATNALATFRSTVNSYNQVIVQNKSNGSAASADFVLNNDQSTDTTFYGNLGINSSTFSGSGAFAAPNATYLSSTSGPLVLGTTTAHPIRFVINGGATDVLYISEGGTAISCFTNFGMRNATDLRFWNSGNTFYAAIQGGGNTVSYILTMPTAPVAIGASALITGSDGQMYFAAPGAGIAFSTTTGNLPTIRAKRALTMQFSAGYTPVAAGPDNVILKVPQAVDGTSLTTFVLRELDIRVETPSAGQSRIQLEKYTGTTAFTLGATGTSMIGGFGVTLTGAAIYTTSVNSFAAGALVTSNDKLRLNWTLLNATHANFTIQLTMEEV